MPFCFGFKVLRARRYSIGSDPRQRVGGSQTPSRKRLKMSRDLLHERLRKVARLITLLAHLRLAGYAAADVESCEFSVAGSAACRGIGLGFVRGSIWSRSVSILGAGPCDADSDVLPR